MLIVGKKSCIHLLLLDSVPTSNGVTDNGMGVVTTIELLRYFIQNPPRHTIIFLLNNFEEGGLIGAKSFTKHPWYSSVKIFINLGKYPLFNMHKRIVNTT